jgi:TRAP transporter 4TM/12TM fusion protein/TRAP transporter TAXI family solute receptor
MGRADSARERMTRSRSRAAGLVIAGASALAAVFHMYAAGVSPFTALVQRPVHLALMATLGFLGVGVQRTLRAPTAPDAAPTSERIRGAVGWILAALSIVVCGYLALENQELVARSGNPTRLDLVMGAVTLLLVLELARRATGWGLIAVCILALGYAFSGPYLPGFLAHRGYGVTRLIEHLYLSTEGVWGIPLGVSADFVYLFVLFGAVLETAGGGALLIALANRIAGRTRGGPAKTAAVASAFMGSLSGSAVANVVTTGTFTIPLMKRAGFRPAFAGAIEAAASTGGQLMPPVMGAGAFILATWTNIPYLEVAVAAIIPAILYYSALLAAIHFRAGRMGIEPNTERDAEPIAERLHLLLPLVVIVVMLGMGRSPMRAAFWGVSSALLIAALRPSTRPSAAQMREIMERAGRGAVQVAAACAAAGIVVGVASLTGIGLRMSELIITLSQGNLFGALVLTGLGSIVLGMGLPTTAAYVVLAALGAPALVQLGVPLLAAHLFIFYFGCISNVTPPVSLAAFAAAGIAGSPPIRTALFAAMLAGAGFIVPFMFVYGPELLLAGPPVGIAIAAMTAVVGVVTLAAGGVGYARTTLFGWERALGLLAAGLLVYPGLLSDAVGLVAVGLVFLRREGERSRAWSMGLAAALAVGVAGALLINPPGDGEITAAVGASDADTAPAADPVRSRGGEAFLSLGTAGTAGIYYPLGGAIASRLSVADPRRQYTAEVSGGSVENVNRVGAAQMDLAMSIASTLFEAQRGEGDFAEPISDLRAIAPLYPNVTHILVPAASSARTVADFAGARVSVGAAGSGTEQLARHVLEAHGLTYDDLEPRYLSFAESSAALRDGAIDAAIISVGYPAAAVLEASTTAEMRLLPIEPRVLEAMFAEHPYYSAGTIPAGAYPGVEDAISTLAVMNWVFSLESLDGEVVTTLLNIFADDRVSLEQVHEMARQIDLSLLAAPPIPLHSAAERWRSGR